MCGGRKRQFIYAKIVDKHGKVLSTGYNSYIRTNPEFNRIAKKLHLPLKEFIHAEAAAAKRLRFTDIPRAYAIFVYRFDNSGHPVLAKPCPICSTIINAIGIRKVYYTDVLNPLDMTFEEYTELKNSARFWIRK